MLPADDDVQSVYQYLIGSESPGEQLTCKPSPSRPLFLEARGWRLRQVGAMLGLELRKTFLRGRARAVGAGRPAAHGAARPALPCPRFRMDNGSESAAGVATVYGAIFQLFYLRLVVFFVCFGIFTYLVRGEIAERSLHFYLLAPLRRDVFLIGKYLAGLVAAGSLFTFSVVAQLPLAFVRRPPPQAAQLPLRRTAAPGRRSPTSASRCSPWRATARSSSPWRSTCAIR